MCRGNRKRDVTTMVTYSHATTPLGQSERAYYLSYFINQLYFIGNLRIHFPFDILTSHFVQSTRRWFSIPFVFQKLPLLLWNNLERA